MDYYQQLGVDRHASVDEIRRAYRRLTRLVHPDQYADPASKQAAEVLMSRINVISTTLLDPDQRYRYDQEQRSQPAEIRAPGSFQRHRLRWWAIGAVAAFVLILSVVWFWANSFGSSFGKTTPAQSSFGKSEASVKSANPATAVPSSLEDSRLAARSASDQADQSDSDKTANPQPQEPPAR